MHGARNWLSKARFNIWCKLKDRLEKEVSAVSELGKKIEWKKSQHDKLQLEYDDLKTTLELTRNEKAWKDKEYSWLKDL